MAPFERRHEKLATWPVFIRRIVESLGLAAFMIIFSLIIGIAGYHWLADLDWIDSLLEASMILGGMGPIKELTTSPAKVFASLYALFSGLVFIGIMGVVLAPIVHRVLHSFHVDDEDIKKGKASKK